MIICRAFLLRSKTAGASEKALIIRECYGKWHEKNEMYTTVGSAT